MNYIGPQSKVPLKIIRVLRLREFILRHDLELKEMDFDIETALDCVDEILQAYVDQQGG